MKPESQPGADLSRVAVVHPFLFVLSPIVYLYFHNLAEIPVAFRELLIAVVAGLVLTSAIGLAAWALVRDKIKAGLIASLLVGIISSYGRLFSTVESEPRSQQARALIGVLLLLVLGVGLILRLRKGALTLTRALNLVSLGLVLTNLGAGVPVLLRTRVSTGAIGAEVRREPQVSAEAKPDIYYIILDSYARSDVLRDNFGYDNAEFISFLEGNGFFVARHSRANYPGTYYSLASSLNYTYLDSIAAETRDGLMPRLIRMIGYSRSAEYLRRQGYRIVTFTSGYTGTDLANADIRLSPRWALSEFQSVLLSTTAIPPILSVLARWSPNQLHRARVLHALNTIPIAGQCRRPVFVFAHIVCPHMPFIFGANGEMVDDWQSLRMDAPVGSNVRRFDIAYRNQVSYLTRLVQTMVEKLLAQSPSSPVVILQADHGPPGGTPSRGQHARRHSILNVLRLPPNGCAELYDSISPVNTFRVIFNRYFDAGLPLLPDRSYFSPTGKAYYPPQESSDTMPDMPATSKARQQKRP